MVGSSNDVNQGTTTGEEGSGRGQSLEASRYGLVVHFQLLYTRGYGPAQLLSVTGPTVSARSGTLTPLFKCAPKRTTAGL